MAYTPEQNWLSKVQNRIIMNGVRAMLIDSQLSRYLWSELLHTKVCQKNRSPSTRLKGITLHEAWTGLINYLCDSNDDSPDSTVLTPYSRNHHRFLSTSQRKAIGQDVYI